MQREATIATSSTTVEPVLILESEAYLRPELTAEGRLVRRLMLVELMSMD